MSLIATLANLGTLNKFCGIMEKAGLPADFFLRAINDREFRTDLVTWARNRLGFEDPRKNPHAVDYRIQIAALRRMNDKFGWNITEEEFHRLAMDVPEWPTGPDSFRSFELRFGEGDNGVALTFERHMECLEEVYGSKFWSWCYLLSGKKPHRDGGAPIERLRLLMGNHTHRHTVKWCLINLNANRRRKSVTAARGRKSLEHQLLVFAWLFPDAVRDMGYKGIDRLIAAGYELNVPEQGSDPSWNSVPYIRWCGTQNKTEAGGMQRNDNSDQYAVPELIE